MADYPVIFNLSGRLCVVVGGGPIGLRKVRGLLMAGARVRLITQDLCPEETVPAVVEILLRAYRPGDLEGAFLALAATGDPEVDKAVAAEARSLGIPISLPGLPAAGDFSLPAVLRRGDLTVTVSTGGRCPALAAHLAGRLGEWLPPAWETVVRISSAIRRMSLAFPDKLPYNQQVIACLLDAGLPQLIAADDKDAVNRLLQKVLGTDITLETLDVEWPDRQP
ncbi:MAG: bifunctional precorrin-2 dehydrogenase/sirohydrochlorin ferrochelatase [Syntrophotaleaceae bacterium]